MSTRPQNSNSEITVLSGIFQLTWPYMLSKCESIPKRNTAHKINALQTHMQLAGSSFFGFEAQLREEPELEGESQLRVPGTPMLCGNCPSQ